MKRSEVSDFPQGPLDRGDRHGQIGRRSFLDAAGRFAMGGLAAGITLARPGSAWALQGAGGSHPASARLVDRLKNQFTFQISVDVASIEQGIGIAAASLAGGVTIVEMGTPLLKNAGVANVVPAFRKRFPDALLLADMKTMDGGGGEARSVYAGGANIIDFLALAGVASARNACAARDEFRKANPDVPRLAFADLLLPNHATTTEVLDAARRMVDAGVDGVGVHLQSDARRADPSLIENDLLGKTARAVFDAVGDAVSVQVVGGLSIAQAKSLAQAGLRAFVISGNLGEPDLRARYDLPPAEIERYVAAFIKEVSSS